MNNMFHIWKTPAGWAAISWSDIGITGLDFGFERKKECAVKARNISGEMSETAIIDAPGWIKEAVDSLDAYFRGTAPVKRLKLDFGEATQFQKAVWHATAKIPYAETRSYTWIAGQTGRPAAVRAAGSALGANPMPVIVPCHRVLRTDGGLGGFGMGLKMKSFLLELERKSAAKPSAH